MILFQAGNGIWKAFLFQCSRGKRGQENNWKVNTISWERGILTKCDSIIMWNSCWLFLLSLSMLNMDHSMQIPNLHLEETYKRKCICHYTNHISLTIQKTQLKFYQSQLQQCHQKCQLVLYITFGRLAQWTRSQGKGVCSRGGGKAIRGLGGWGTWVLVLKKKDDVKRNSKI